MTKKQKKALWRILIALALFVVALLLSHTGVLQGYARLVVFLIPYALVGYDVLLSAALDIRNGQVFGEKFLMAVATVGALCLGEYPEAVFVMLFFQVGELFESLAVGKSRASIAALMEIRPESAVVERDGEPVEVEPEEVEIGEILLVRPGEKVPIDGVVIEGSSTLNTAALTGESLPRDVTVGDEVISGCVNLQGKLRVQTTKCFEDSTVAKILDLVENASEQKSKSETFITRFARVYTPSVVIAAVLLAILPSLITGQWAQWIHRALIFLVISCPCALVISVPLTYFGGIGGASRAGVLVKGSQYLDTLSAADTLVVDKTGTLTKGSFSVIGVYPQGCTQAQLLELAAHAEAYSDHPISQSLRGAWSGTVDTHRLGEMREMPGHGVVAMVDGVEVLAGNEKLLQTHQITLPAQPIAYTGTIVHVAVDGSYAGCLVIADTLKPGVSEAIAACKALGVRTVAMLTGDTERVAQEIASQTGVDEVYAELLPHEKVEKLQMLLARQAQNPQAKLVYVGDGINDAPVLSCADVGMAMGALGSDAAIEAADIVLMDDSPSKIPVAIRIARKTRRIARENIIFALGVKVAVLVLGAFGLANLWMASFADVGVCVIAVLNAMRAMR